MATAEKVKSIILERATCLGNSNRGTKELCSDLVADYLTSGGKMQTLCDGTFLSSITIERMRLLTETESGLEYRPNVDTCERILRFFNAEMHFKQLKAIKPQYANKPKVIIE